MSEAYVEVLSARNGNPPPGLWDHCAVHWNGCIFLLCGAENRTSKFNDKIYCYHLKKQMWSLVGTETLKKPAARIGSTACVRKDSIILFGGQTPNGQLLNDVWEYNFKTESWLQRDLGNKGFPSPRAFHTSFYRSLDDSLYVIGGKLKNGSSNDIYRFRFDNEIWEKVRVAPHSKLPTPHAHAAVALTSDEQEVYFYGGESMKGKHDEFFVFRFAKAEWDEVDILDTRTHVPPMRGHVLLNTGVSLILHGGSHASSHFYEYILSEQVWRKMTTKGASIFARDNHSCAQVKPGEFVFYGGERDFNRSITYPTDLEILRVYHFRHQFNHAQARFAQMLREQKMCDVEFIVEGKSFPVHIAMMVRSPQLASLIESALPNRKISLSNVSASVFHDFITWLYSYSLDSIHQIVDLAKLAFDYSIFDLVSYCVRQFRKMLNARNVISLFIQIEEREEQVLRLIAQHYIHENYTIIMGDSSNVMLLAKHQSLLQEMMLLSRQDKPLSVSEKFPALKSVPDQPSAVFKHHLASLYKERAGALSDFSLQSSDGESFKLHRAVLCGESEIFLNLLAGSRGKRNILINCKSPILSYLVEYCYTNDIRNKEILKVTTLREIATIAHAWMPTLEDWCISVLLEKVSPKNALDMLVVCQNLKDLENIDILKQVCKIHLAEHKSPIELAGIIADLLAYPSH